MRKKVDGRMTWRSKDRFDSCSAYRRFSISAVVVENTPFRGGIDVHSNVQVCKAWRGTVS